MADQDLNIKIKLLDEFTSKFNQFEKNLQRVGERGLKAGQQMRQLGRDISQLGQTITFVGAGITAPLALAFKSAEKYSLSVKAQMDILKNVMLGFQVSVAESMLPTVTRLTNVLGLMLQKWNELDPVMRQHIVNATLMTGVYLTIGGTLVLLVSRLVRFAGTIVTVVSKMALFATVHPVIAGLAVAIGAVILMMNKWQDLGSTVLNTMEIGALMVAIGWEKVALANAKVIQYTAALAGNMQMVAWAAEQIVYVKDAIAGLEGNISNIMSSGKGKLVDLTTDIAKFAEELKKILSGEIKFNYRPIVETFNALEQLAKSTAQAMTNSFGQLFFTVFSGQMRDITQVFADFGRSIIQILAQVLAKFILIKTIGGISIGGTKLSTYFHSGGVVKAHSGYLANDEVPAVLQTGERVLSRGQVRALGGQAGIDGMLSGRGSGTNIYPVMIIKAWDSADIHRHASEFKAMMVEAIRGNSQVRGAIKSFC